MINNSSDLWKLASDIANTPSLEILLVLEMIISISALFPNALLLYTLMRVRIFPMNLRLLLGHLSLNLIWYSLAFWIKAISTLTIIAYGNDHLLITQSRACKFSELANTVPLQNAVYSSLALCTERAYSTVLYKKYEQEHSGPWLAVILIIFVWTVSLANQLNSFFAIDPMEKVPICESLLSITPSSALLILTLNLSVESVCVLLATVIYFWNNRKLRAIVMNKAQTTLGARFQISQNVEINWIMMPSMVLQSLCYVPNYIFLLLVVFGLDHFPIPVRVVLVHVNYFWKLCFGFLHPLVAFNRKARLVHHLKKRSPLGLSQILSRAGGGGRRRVNPIVVNSTAAAAGELNLAELAMVNTNAHFEALRSMWETQDTVVQSRDKYRLDK